MSHRNTTRRKSLWLTLFLVLGLFPLSAQALDLYLSGMEVTGGVDYVIKGNTPADKLYTGTIICSLELSKLPPKTTTLTTTLLRDNSTEVRTEEHIYLQEDWIKGPSGLYYISILTSKGGYYIFDMPDNVGLADTNLRTGSYSFKFEITSSSIEIDTKNNIEDSFFDYTVFSGNLFYDRKTPYTISSLTPSLSKVCSGDTYLSAIRGEWDADPKWWPTHFANSGLCTNSSASSDKYSTDLTVLKDVSLTKAPTLGGQFWSIKGHNPASLSLNGMRIECDGSPPPKVTLNTSLQSSVMQSGYELVNYSQVITPVWQVDTLNRRYYFTLGKIYYSLPDDGPTIGDLQTGLHTFVSTITALGDTTSANNQKSNEFNYTVYSGLLYFNDVETVFSNITFNTPLCGDGSSLNLLSVSGSWSDVFGTEAMSATNLCADTQNNPDGYSRDLQIFSGEVNFDTISATISGLDIDFYSSTLNASGGSFSSAMLTLPENITVHAESGGVISPAGFPYMNFSGKTFTQTMASLTLIVPSAPYLHSYGLPFYIKSDAFRFPLNSSSDMELVNPFPVYVHTEAVNALAPEDTRTSFPSNDILFHQPLSAANQITFNQDGMDGHLDFQTGGLWALQTSFPKARITFNPWRLTLLNGAISTGSIPGLGVAMRFGRDCHNAECADSLAGSRWYTVSAAEVRMTSSGAFGAQFEELGPTLDETLHSTNEDTVAWGDFQVDIPGTYVRHDRNRQGAFMVPGFIMQNTSDTLTSPLRLGQILLGSHTFKGVSLPDNFAPLHDQKTDQATLGDGIFAGINLGPEIYTNLKEGIGQFLGGDTRIRFFDADTPNPQIGMKDRDAVKYVLRPGGLTGVFNTTIDPQNPITINIYDYNISFHRFAFRQDRNTLDGETFIDGGLTLKNGPVANGVSGNQQDFEVGFSNLDLTCNGNLGSGQVDTEPEPKWPLCDNKNTDGDGRTDEGCQELVYWNMPVLLTAMGFENVPGSATNAACPTEDRQLRMHTYNQIDGLGQPLTMSALYSPVGVLDDQELYGTVQTRFDKPQTGSEPGFGIRLRTAYLNQVDTSLPQWNGFAVLAGYTDVPLFNDTRLAGHFDNIDPDLREKFSLNLFQDETDGDSDSDGVPDSYTGDTPTSLRERLTTDTREAPKPYFEYSWPTDTMVSLNYHAKYQPASGSDMPWFQGLSKKADILGVINVSSVPDYINPKKTKFSFGVSADVAALQDFQLDLGNYTDSLDTFLQGTLNVSGDFSMENILCYTPSGGTEICLHNLEESMLSLTGGDLTSLLSIAIDEILQQAPLATAIHLAAEGLNQAHQAPAQIRGLLMEPLKDARTEITTRITGELAGQFKNLYTHLSAVAIYNPTDLAALSGAPSLTDIEGMKAEVETIRNRLSAVVDQLHNGFTALGQGAEILTRAGGIIDVLDGKAADALSALQQLEDAIDTGLTDLLDTGIEPTINPLLIEIDNARQVVGDVRNSIEAVDLGALGDALELAALASGAAIDTSLLDDAQQTINSSLDELDTAISRANQVITDTYASLPLAGMITKLKQLIDDSDPANVRGKLTDLRQSLTDIKAPITNLKEIAYDQIAGLHRQLNALHNLIDSSTETGGLSVWTAAMDISKNILDGLALDFQTTVISGTLGSSIAAIPPGTDFPTLFENYLYGLIDAAFIDILEDTAVGGVEDQLENMVLAVTTALPQPSEEDIRNMIRTSIVNSPAVVQINTAFYAHFGLLSDLLDSISTQLTAQINGLIRQTVDAVSEGLSEQLATAMDPVGGWGTSLQSAGIDGYALISQDEFERIHMEAEFIFEGEPDPTSYNAALDVTSWKADNGKSGCVDPNDPNSGNYYDVTISTHDVSADMLGMDIGIKTAMLGFTINSAPIPVGVFGNCYLDGEINFETLVLEDLGLEAGIGALEIYFGATGAGRFEEYRIPKAAFFVGKSCDFGVLERLDPEVADFIGKISPLYGAYVRGSVEVPIYNGGCWFTIGLGADIGAWYFTEPSPGTYGGLVGGSAYGRLACLAALKGKVQCLGQKSGSEYKFSGDGWAGAGTGSCSPGSWKSVRDVRRDKWCLTGDATFGATYENGWNIDGPNVNCCD